MVQLRDLGHEGGLTVHYVWICGHSFRLFVLGRLAAWCDGEVLTSCLGPDMTLRFILCHNRAGDLVSML